MEKLVQHAERNWGNVRTNYERLRIQQEWQNFQKRVIEEQKSQAQERGEEFELDIDDDQGVSALTREWVGIMLAPDEEETECSGANEEETTIEPEHELTDNNRDDQQEIEDSENEVTVEQTSDLDEETQDDQQVTGDIGETSMTEENESNEEVESNPELQAEEEESRDEEEMDQELGVNRSEEEDDRDLAADRSDTHCQEKLATYSGRDAAADAQRAREDAYSTPKMDAWLKFRYGQMPREQVPEHLRSLWDEAQEARTTCGPLPSLRKVFGLRAVSRLPALCAVVR
jgi:hypothetical protein